MTTMPTRRLGSLEVTVVGLGCNNFGGRIDEAATAQVISATLGSGINFLDTADVYGGTQSEEFLGRVLGRRRRDVVLATKFGMANAGLEGGASPAYARSALDASLRRLQTDYVDLYQLHRPDPSVPMGDTLEAMGEMVRAGKVREIGCSNFSAQQLEEAERAVKEGAPRFVSVQNEYSLLQRQAEQDVLPACERLGVGFIPYFPLMMGLLSGKFRRGEPLAEGTRIGGMPADRQKEVLTEARWQVIEELTNFAEAHGHSLLELAIAWLAAQPSVVSVIAGATKPEQVRANATAGNWALTDDEVAEVSKLASL